MTGNRHPSRQRCRIAIALWLASLAAFVPVPLGAQATEGSILGTVTDNSGAAIPGAKVAVTSVETGFVRTTSTNVAGEYVVSNLAVGSYVVTVQAEGFKQVSHPPVTMAIKSRVRVDATLQVGQVTELVEVTGTVPLIRTDTAEVGAVISRDILREVPVFGRNFLSLATLVPGTTPGFTDGRQRQFSGAAVTVAGASAESNNFIIDGISNNMEFSGATGVVPAIDAIQEFAVQASQYSAEFGRAGGGVINVAIKSGTNDLHGFAYNYLRNDKLDARRYDFSGTNPPQTPLRRNQFGAGLGGPVIKNRVFFFGNYEGTRFPSNLLGSGIVPTAREKRGDFSQSGFSIFDPTTSRPDPSNPSRLIRDPFPGDVIPASRIDPIGAKLISFYPEPNFTDPNPRVRDNYRRVQQNNDDLNSFNIKSDLNLTSRDIVAGRVSQQRGGRVRGGWMPDFTLGARGALDATNTGMSYVRVLAPTLVNEARIGYNYLRFGNEMMRTDGVLSEFKIPGLNIIPAADGYPDVQVVNLTTTSIQRPIKTIPTPFVLVEHSWQYMDNLSWHKGNHALKFGGEVGRVANNRFQARPGGAILYFNGTYTTQIVGGAREAIRSGTPDLLLALARDFSTNFALDAVRTRSQRVSAFVQDDWRATRKLTLSLGLRYDYFGPYREEQNRVGNFDMRTGERVVPESLKRPVQEVLGLPGGVLPAGWRYGKPQDVIPKTNWTDFGPRFGFAYAASPRLVFRGGYGIFFAATVANNFSNAGTEGTPFFYDFSMRGEQNRPLVMREGFPSGGVAAPLAARTFGAYYAPLSRHDPYTQKYNLNIQYSLLSRTAIEVGYSGQRALAFPALVPGNVPAPGPGIIQDNRPFPNVGFFWQYLPVNDSNYNGLEITFRQKDFHGLTVQSAFTFSKSLGYTTGTDGTFSNPHHFRYDYGPLNYDFSRRWVTAWVYRIPGASRLPKFARAVVGSWETSGLVTLQSGFPFTVAVSGHDLNNGMSSRADALRNPNLPSGQRTMDRWFDTSAFGMPAQYRWGNQGKNILRGPGLAVLDFGLQKWIPFGERRRLALRMESTNFFNRVQLGWPNLAHNAPSFGMIRGLQSGPRNIQLVLKLEF